MRAPAERVGLTAMSPVAIARPSVAATTAPCCNCWESIDKAGHAYAATDHCANSSAPISPSQTIRLNGRVISIWRKCSSRNTSGAAVRQATGRRLNLFPSEGNQHLSLNGPHELDERITGLRWQQSAFSHEHV